MTSERASGIPRIVYGGDSLQQRSDCSLLPWHSITLERRYQ